MKFSLNCLFLGEASDQSIPVIIGEEIIVDNNRIKYKDITVSNVKSLILSQRKIDCSLNNLKLWIVDRVSIDKNDEMLEKFSTEDDIKEKLGGELMNPRNFLSKYFNENSFNDDESKSAVHIIVQLLTTTGYPNKRPRLDFDNIPIDLSLPPTQLLHGTGYYWDYQEPPELENILRSEILTLYDLFKNNDRDKSNTPIFFMISGAGCGKSRNATELPNVLRRIFKDHSDLGPRLLNALVFNIPLENGTLLNTREEIKANVAIAKRMLYQIRTHQMISWAQIREDTQTLLIDDVLMRCANQKNVALKELTVILIIDGLQVALENINYGMNKSSLFYSFMTDIALLATNNESPLVIACCTATLARPFNEMIATSHQKRIFLPICSLRPPERDGKPIFEDTPLHNMLISDMGGNGRALEALELALKGIDFKNTNFASIAQKVFDQLQDRYIEWISLTRYLTPISQN
ncbi:crinkler (CRN) family protein, putative [Rhizophagus clarus]|uniref:Crinkler (CRN) family protein, putative n=1 Tax=Rhizophagus clarus TaxID=94130 RepID=A0A8H3LSQ1_9GLOM|nr:crinkler (CRN) family protein, putative [Rhizophagus clarus]